VYLAGVWSCALRETKKLWTPQRTWVAFASPVITVPIRGLVSDWNMHELLTTAWITVLVVAGGWVATFLFDLVRAPALLHKQQQRTIEEQARSIRELEKRTSRAAPSMREQANRRKVADAIAGASHAEKEFLKYILDQEEIEATASTSVFSRELLENCLQRWEGTLIQRHWERHQNVFSIIRGLTDALSHVLYESENDH